MINVTLDQMVRSVLLKKQQSIHWYLQYLKLAADCVRELSYDVLQIVDTVVLDVTSYGAIKLPKTYVDWVKVGGGAYQIMYTLEQYKNLKRLTNTNADGNPIPYGVDYGGVYYGADYWYENKNIWGEDMGGYYNTRVSAYWNGFEEIRERGEIQLSEVFCGKKAILEFISNGATCGAASRIHPYAQQAIEDYIEWQSSPGRISNQSAEGQKYFNSVRILKGRLDSMTAGDLIMTIEGARYQSIK